jgi:glycerol-3-phosphate dehydrogenase
VKGRKTTYWNALPGGDIGPGFLLWRDSLAGWMPAPLLTRLARAYGTRLQDVIGDATSLDDLGRHFGAGLYEAEARHLLTREFARTADDILWRRTKIGLHMNTAERAAFARWVEEQSRA